MAEKNKKAMIEDFLRIILWIIFFILALAGIYFLVQKIVG